MIFGRDDNADCRLAIQLVAKLQKRRARGDCYIGGNIAAPQMIGHGSARRFECMRFLPRGSGGRAGGSAPMIEDMRDVPNAPRLYPLDNPQREVIILAPVEFRPQPSHLSHQRSPINPEMGNHVLSQEQIRVPIALEMRIVAPAPSADLVLVAVDHIELGVAGDFASDHVERMRWQNVVMVQEGYIFTGRDIDGAVGRLRNPSILWP